MTAKRTFAVASLIATVSLSALGYGAAVNAQVPPRPAAPAAGQPAPQTRAQMEQRMAQRRAQRTADLATVLRLSPAQRPALEAFVASRTRAGRGSAARTADAQARRALTPQQRLDQRQAMVTRRAEALRTFTAALNPEQRQVFDALNRLQASDGRGRGRGGDRMGGPGRRDGDRGMRGSERRDGRGDRGGRGGQRDPGSVPPAQPVR